MNSLKRGFTLIELLVVIAIIGILSSVVLASLNTARDKGANAAIKSNLANIRSQAEIFYDGPGNNSYVGVCTNSVVVNAINAAKQASGIITPTNFTTGAGSAGVATCHDTGIAWAIEVPLKTPSTSFQCVDASGQSTTTVSSTLGGTDEAVCG